MVTRLSLLVALVASAVLVAATPAFASLQNEVRAGRAVAQQLQSHRTSCDGLTDADAEHLGEYVMDRMVGSRSQHEVMNARMSSMMGSANEERMHELMGRRYARCTNTGAGAMMAPGMMGGGPSSTGGWGAMMNSRGYSWMHDGTWQHMSRSDWRRVGDAWMSPGMMRDGHQGWTVGAVSAVVLGALLLVVLALAATGLRPWRRRPTPPVPA